MFYKMDASENFAKTTEKHLCRSVIFKEIIGYRSTLSEKICAIPSIFLLNSQQVHTPMMSTNQTLDQIFFSKSNRFLILVFIHFLECEGRSKLLLLFFSFRVQYCGRENNTANIVLFSTNQIADILYFRYNYIYIT